MSSPLLAGIEGRLKPQVTAQQSLGEVNVPKLWGIPSEMTLL